MGPGDRPRGVLLATGRRCKRSAWLTQRTGRPSSGLYNSSDLRVWDPATGKTRAVLTRPRQTPRSLAFAGDRPGTRGQLPLTPASRSGTCRAGRVGPGRRGERSGVHGLAFASRRKVLATVTPAYACPDTETLAERWALPRIPRPWYPAVALSADGRWLAYPDGPTIYLVDARTGEVARSYRGHVAAVTGLAFAPDSDRLYSSSLDTTVLVWDVPPSAP